MKALNLSAITLLFFYVGLAQVGINTTNPKAMLDITASGDNADITNGILIPRIDDFPTTTPGADQAGMLIYITGNSVEVNPPSKGFYFWNWDKVSSNGEWASIGANSLSLNDLTDVKSDFENANPSLFFGEDAGQNDPGNVNNIGIGPRSLQYNTTGNNNVAIGREALRGEEGGSSLGIGNIAIGDFAGFVNEGRYNVFLGHNAGLNETGDEKLYISNNNTQPPLIYGEFNNYPLANPLLGFNAFVGINHQDPTHDLHIKQENNFSGNLGKGGIVLENSTTSDTWRIYHTADGTLGFEYKTFDGEGVEQYKLFQLSSTDPGANARNADSPYIARRNTASDIRLKKNIGLLSGALTNILDLKAYQYNYKKEKDTAKKTLGFMAQDVQKVYPELVGEIGGGYLGVDYGGFGVLAIKAIQEQQVQIEQQQQEIEELKEQIKHFTHLEKRIEALEHKQ